MKIAFKLVPIKFYNIQHATIFSRSTATRIDKHKFQREKSNINYTTHHQLADITALDSMCCARGGKLAQATRK